MSAKGNPIPGTTRVTESQFHNAFRALEMIMMQECGGAPDRLYTIWIDIAKTLGLGLPIECQRWLDETFATRSR